MSSASSRNVFSDRSRTLTNTLKLEMKKIRVFRGASKSCKQPLIESNNNDIQDGSDQALNWHNNLAAQNILNAKEEQRLVNEDEIVRELAELLDSSEGSSRCSAWPGTSLGQQSRNYMERYVSQHFPKPPADLDQSLNNHLSQVQTTVQSELVKLGPWCKSKGLLKCLVDCYHRHTLDHISGLFQNISSTQKCFVLMKWVMRTYLSQVLLGDPGLQEMAIIKEVDLLVFIEWAAKAKDKLLESVQKDIREVLENILQNERSQGDFNNEENCISLHVDTIQAIEALSKGAQQISPELSNPILEVCFRELLTFLGRYNDEQIKVLEKKSKMDKAETVHFFRTLNACKNLKQYIQSKATVNRILLLETEAALANMEALTLKLLMKMVADIAERHLKSYFRSENKQYFLLMQEVRMGFPKLPWCQDVQTEVMDEVYKLIAHTYLKHLVKTSQRKLKKCWSPRVGETVTEDAQLLHVTISDLAPGVQQCNLMMLEIQDLLEQKDTEAMKVTVASMQDRCPTWSEDLELLPTLLRWKGLSEWKVNQVLYILSEQEPATTSASGFSCLVCW